VQHRLRGYVNRADQRALRRRPARQLGLPKAEAGRYKLSHKCLPSFAMLHEKPLRGVVRKLVAKNDYDDGAQDTCDEEQTKAKHIKHIEHSLHSAV
jgi:hypothetical protein